MVDLPFDKQREEISRDLKRIRSTFMAKVLTLMMAGFGLVAALAWNDAIQTLVKEVFGESSGGIIAKFVYALLVTGLLAIVSIKISKDEEKV